MLCRSCLMFETYSGQILILAEPTNHASTSDKQQMKSVLSVSDFSAYFILLRRYSELMDIGRPSLLTNVSDIPECGICMGHADEIVLPCLHSMCSSCATKWVDAHGKCPFCRHHFLDQRRMEKDQWQVSCTDIYMLFFLKNLENRPGSVQSHSNVASALVAEFA